MILFVDSSTNNGMLAIAELKEKKLTVLSEISFIANLNYSEKLFTAFDFLKDDIAFEYKDIEQIIITVGPGSFTGLRIAYSFAKALSLSTGAKFTGVSTLWSYMYSLPDWVANGLVVLKSTARDLFLLATKDNTIFLDEQVLDNETFNKLDLNNFYAIENGLDILKNKNGLKVFNNFKLSSRGMYKAYLENKVYDNINYIKKSYAEC